MRVFLAGASGVLGRRLLPLLIGAGHDVTGMARSPGGAEAVRTSKARPVVCDALDAAKVREVVVEARPDVVIHQVTNIPKALDPRKVKTQFEMNDRLRREGTRNLVDAAIAAGARRIVAQSIAFAYAPGADHLRVEEDPIVDPPEPMRRTIAAVRDLEAAVTQTPGIDGTVLRYGFFYGPGSSYAPDGHTAGLVRKRRFPIVGDGRGTWSFIHVDDAALATAAAIDAPPGTYNVVDDDPAHVREWLPFYAQTLAAPAPMRVPTVVGRVGAGAYGVYLMTKLPGASNAKAKTVLGWEPRYSSWRDGFVAYPG